jgi:hypothetical protein
VDMLLKAGDGCRHRRTDCVCQTLNKVARGEIDALHIVDLSEYDMIPEKLANEHEEKMSWFVAEWYNTAPDVQDGVSASTNGSRRSLTDNPKATGRISR